MEARDQCNARGGYSAGAVLAGIVVVEMVHERKIPAVFNLS